MEELHNLRVVQSVMAIVIQPMRLCQTFVTEQTINYLTILIVVATDIWCIHSFRQSEVSLIRFGNALKTFSHLLAHSIV